MNTTAAMHPSVSVMPLFYARAKQYLYDRDRLEDADEAQIESIAQWLRYEEFRRAIEPLGRIRDHAISAWLMIQTDVHAKYPEWLEESVRTWNEMIAREAQKFGYDPAAWDMARP